MQTIDLVVIGGGMGGLMVAHGALKLGFSVVIIDKHESVHTSCLYNSCIPSKALAHVAGVAHTITTAGEFGIDAAFLPVKYNKIRDYLIKTVNKISSQDPIAEIKQLGGRIIIGDAKFLNKEVIIVNNQKIKAKKILIATGALPFIPNIKGLHETKFITIKDLFVIDALPKKLIILGGQPAAIEIAQSLSRLGVDVTLIIESDTILPDEDIDLTSVLQESLDKDGVKVVTKTKVKEVYIKNKRKVVECYDNNLEEDSYFADEILIASGSLSNIKDLGLQHAEINYNKEGVVVDQKLRTNVKHIYAAGDVVADTPKLAHVVEYQANVILSNAFYKVPIKTDYTNFPYVVFTKPEIAHVGVRESQAILGSHKKMEVLRYDYKDLDAAIIKGATKGKVKLILKANKLAGATIVGEHASEIICELALAINTGATMDELLTTVTPYPTYSQVVKHAASSYMAKDMFSEKNQKIVKWVNDKLS